MSAVADTDRAFVRREVAPSLPPPLASRGMIGFLRESLFSGPLNIALTVVSLGLIALIVPPAIRFLVIDAVWEGTDREACLGTSGACWPFVKAKFAQFVYGFYPVAERWRPNIVFALGVILIAPLLVPAAPFKRLNAILFFGVFPVVGFVLLTGGNLDLRAFLLGRILNWEALAGLRQTGGLRVGFWTDYAVSALVLISLAAGLARVVGGQARAAAFTALAVLVLLGVVFFAVDVDFGLQPVETRLWGGLLITLVVAITGIVASLPLGILLALGRRSEMPIVRVCSVVFIEFWRGVPLITVLYFASYMLPLFLPTGVNFDGLLRVLVGVTLFAAAYMAEVVRGGLQAIPRGQYEAAQAVGLGYWQTMGLVVLPQALTLVIPGIVNTFIGLFKDTTLVLIVAIFDFLGQLRAAFTDPNWATPVTLYTGFAFAGIVYFVFCYGMSRYSLFLERRAAAGRRR
jgi:general L-amino acid transport system permease protein